MHSTSERAAISVCGTIDKVLGSHIQCSVRRRGDDYGDTLTPKYVRWIRYIPSTSSLVFWCCSAERRHEFVQCLLTLWSLIDWRYSHWRLISVVNSATNRLIAAKTVQDFLRHTDTSTDNKGRLKLGSARADKIKATVRYVVINRQYY